MPRERQGTAPTAPRLAVALAALLLAAGPASAAGTVRDNPFKPDTTAEEDKAIADGNVVATTMRGLLPEMTSEISRSVGREQKAALDVLKDEMNARMAAQAKLAPAGASTASLRSSVGPNVGAMKFYACADGRVLYKDSGGALVVATPPSDQPSPCP